MEENGDKGKEKEQVSKRRAFVDKYRENHPDDEFDDNDDEALFDRISRAHEESRNSLNKYQEESKKLTDLFSSDPRAAGMFVAWKEGGNPVGYLHENFGDEFKDALDDPEKKEEFGKSYQKWLDKVANEKKMKEECDDNLQATFKTLEEMQKEQGWTDEESTNIFNFVYEIVMDGIYNRIKPETFEMAAKALNYERDVEDAAITGEKKGRNTKIVEKLQGEKGKAGVPPALGGTNGGGQEAVKEKRYNPFLSGK